MMILYCLPRSVSLIYDGLSGWFRWALWWFMLDFLVDHDVWWAVMGYMVDYEGFCGGLWWVTMQCCRSQ